MRRHPPDRPEEPAGRETLRPMGSIRQEDSPAGEIGPPLERRLDFGWWREALELRRSMQGSVARVPNSGNSARAS